MSFNYNYKFWVASQKELEDILKRQEVFKALKPIEDQALTHYLFAELYARYVQLVNKLGYIYHHTFQVQKRDVVKQLVESASERLLELKNELKILEFSEFIYIDKTLVERKLTPDDVSVWTPKYFPYWRSYKIQEMISGPRKNVSELEDFIEVTDEHTTVELQGGPADIKTKVTSTEKIKLGPHLIHEVKVLDSFKEKLREIVILIQSHERARVGRVYLTNIRYNPAVYKPKMRESETMIKYNFTHKPAQAMLTPIKRTSFEANYFSQRKDLRTFNYYVKPVYQEVSHLLEDDLSDSEESDGEKLYEKEELTEIEENSFEGSEYSDQNEDIQNLSEIHLNDHIEKLKNTAALKIQCFWRGFRDRKKYKNLLENKMFVYGMGQKFKPKSKRVKIYEERTREAARHRQLKEKHDAEFLKFCEDERARILRVRGPWIMEDISDNIRAWFREFYDRLGCFHPYPEEVKGGTILLLKGETMDVFEYQSKLKAGKLTKEQMKKIKDKERELRLKMKEKLKKINMNNAKRRAQLAKAGIYDMNDEMERSKSIAAIENTINKYKTEWAAIDEKLNNRHEPIKEWITSDYYEEIHRELQLTVDELMRLEYELLQRALAKDKKKKYRAPKKKKGKENKVVLKKDLTADRSIESLFYELQDAGIVRTYPKKTFDYFVGERNHCAYTLLNEHLIDTPNFKGEIKDVLSEYIIGMGPLNITKPKSICLVGPTHGGKKLLCDILATEIDAVVLDISPENITKYQSDMKYFLHIIVKMAIILQPTILYIRDVHRVFWKKVPRQFENMNPRLLQPYLKKVILKSIKKEDKVFVLATTDAPWAANGKMKRAFQKILLVPKTEYSTSFMLRRNVTLQTRNIPRDFDFSSLALVTRDYASGDIVANVEETLNLRRRMELIQRPLKPMEFIDNFLEKNHPHFPPEPKEWEQFVKWYRRASKMAKKRASMMKMKEALRAKQKIKK